MLRIHLILDFELKKLEVHFTYLSVYEDKLLLHKCHSVIEQLLPVDSLLLSLFMF
jgi:hypothetical protein